MTVVPGVEPDTVNLICDHCDRVVAGIASRLRDDEVVWPVVAEHGWNGSPFATGPHRCPSCSRRMLGPDRRRQDVPRRRRPVDEIPPLRVDELPHAAVVTLYGAVDILVAEPLRDALGSAVRSGRHIVLDLSAVGLIDSTGLGILVRAHQEAKQHGHRLCLAAPSRFIRTVLHTMRLDSVFATFDDRQQALTAIGAGQ